MRVCLVYDCLFPYTVGGAERWYRNLAERLARDGHEVTYITLRQWPRDERPQIDGLRVVAVGPRMQLYTEDGRRRILPPLVFGVGVLWHLALRGGRYEVVHTCAFPYFSLLAAAALRPLRRFRLVVDWFEVWSGVYWREYLGRAGVVGLAVQRLCALVPQRAFCFSQLHAARLREEGLRGRLSVLRGLYAPPAERLPPRAPDRLALFAGRLIPEKRVTLALAAIGLAARRIEGLRGEIIGEGPERGALDAAIAQEGLGEVVSAPGFGDAAMLERDMRRALCLLITSRREGYGMVVVEAAALGTPSIVVRGEDNAAGELIEDGVNGVLVEADTAEAVAEAIVGVERRGMALRESTARWFERHSGELSLDSSLAAVLEAYDRELSTAE